MALFSAAQLRNAGQAEVRKSWAYAQSAKELLREEVRKQSSSAQYDIFLSHAFRDAELILGLRNALVGMGFSVYVDWLEDPTLDRERVTPETAKMLRIRMRACSSLLFATSDAAADSKWMPWELGYFDAYRGGRVAIIPVSESQHPGDDWKGREYLGLYPYITRNTAKGTLTETLWAHTSPSSYVIFREWLKGTAPFERK
jgi:hypothetical protein